LEIKGYPINSNMILPLVTEDIVQKSGVFYNLLILFLTRLHASMLPMVHNLLAR